MASRILGMGDIVTLVEKAQEQFDGDNAAQLEAKLRKSQFTLEDFLEQLQEVRKMVTLGTLDTFPRKSLCSRGRWRTTYPGSIRMPPVI